LIQDALINAMPGLASYPATAGEPALREAITSWLKRRYGVKDAGKLIPGHGGLLDRVDGLMFAVVVVACGRLIVGMTGGAA
jgi:phosphatidate cytidylyltransferase